MADGVVRFYPARAIGRVRVATQVGLTKLAFDIEAGTKQNIVGNDQVDTGFMLNSVYTVTPASSGYAAAQAAAQACTRGRDGRAVDHIDDMAMEVVRPLDLRTGVAVGANYAIYQELRKSFFYAAAEAVLQRAGGTLERVYSEQFHD
jgi:hypothetical protein